MRPRDLLLVIDMQNVYREGGTWACRGTDAAAERILAAIRSDAFHRVLFTRFLASDRPKGVWRDYNTLYADVIHDPDANRLMDPFCSLPDCSPIYTKHVYSALHIPEVRAAAEQADRVAVTGAVAECCVLSTVFSLIDLGKPVLWLTDCIAGIDRTREQAVQTVLTDLIPLHIRPMTLDDYLSEA